MRQWAYRVFVGDLKCSCDEEQAELSALGEQGWELVSVVSLDRQLIFYFKRGSGEPGRL